MFDGPGLGILCSLQPKLQRKFILHQIKSSGTESIKLQIKIIIFLKYSIVNDSNADLTVEIETQKLAHNH